MAAVRIIAADSNEASDNRDGGRRPEASHSEPMAEPSSGVCAMGPSRCREANENSAAFAMLLSVPAAVVACHPDRRFVSSVLAAAHWKCEVRPRGEPGFLANNMNSIARHLRLPPRRIVLWHSLAAVPLGTLIAIGASLSYHYHDLADQNQQRVNRSYQLLDGIDGLFSSVEAAALAERDFIITGDADALGQFQRSITAFRNRSLHLQLLVKNEPIQAAALSDIDKTIAGQFAEFSQAIETRNAQGFEGARVIVALQATGVTMEALRQKIDKFAEAERHLVNDGLRIEKLHEHRIIISGIAIAIASLLIRLCITMWVRHAGRLRSGRSQTDALIKAGAS